MIDPRLFKVRSDSYELIVNEIEDPTAIVNINEFEERYKTPPSGSLNQYVYSIAEVLNEINVGKFIRVIGYLGVIGEVTPFELMLPDGSIKRIAKTSIEITDFSGNSLPCKFVAYDEFREKLDQAKAIQSLVIFEGTLISVVERYEQYYFFYLKDIVFQITPLDIIHEREYDETQLKDKITYHSNRPGGIRAFIREELINNLNISGLDTAEELSKAIDFMILQSLSRGMSSEGRYCNKLHSLVIGAPASGKKLLTLVAKILNPIAFEISSTDKKVTPAGLVGRVIVKNGSIISKPGLLPLASRGVVCIQDFHELTKPGSKKDIFPIFSKMMEDGTVEDSTSAMTEHHAITSLHVDMNRWSQVYSEKDINNVNGDLGIPKNVISRFDFIMEIPPNLERQFQIVLNMTEGKKELLSSEHNLVLPEWAKKLKRIVAFMATEYNKTEISEEISEYLTTKLEAILKDNVKVASFEAVGEIISARISISIHKYAKAIACSKLKWEVDVEDIDEAFDYLSYKLNFLTYYSTDMVASATKVKEKDKRQSAILEEFEGKEFAISNVIEFLHSLNLTVTEKTIKRDISELVDSGKIKKIKHGAYCV